MYLKIMGSPRLNETMGLWKTHYYVFTTAKKRITTNMLDKIRLHLLKCGEERYQQISLDILKTFFITRYDTMQESKDIVTLEAEGSTSQLLKDCVTVINLDVEG